MNNTELIAQLREHDPMDGLYAEVPTSILEKAADALEAAQVAASKQATDNNKIVDLIAKQRGTNNVWTIKT